VFSVPSEPPPKYSDDNVSVNSSKSSGFRPGALKRSNTSGKNSVDLGTEDDDSVLRLRENRAADWGIGDDLRMGLE
jgi:hypothetical protein